MENGGRAVHLVLGPTDGDEVGDDLVGMVEAVAQDVGVDFVQPGSGLLAV